METAIDGLAGPRRRVSRDRRPRGRARPRASSPLRLVEGVPEWLSPLTTVIPGQLAAFRLAQLERERPRQPARPLEDHAHALRTGAERVRRGPPRAPPRHSRPGGPAPCRPACLRSVRHGARRGARGVHRTVVQVASEWATWQGRSSASRRTSRRDLRRLGARVGARSRTTTCARSSAPARAPCSCPLPTTASRRSLDALDGLIFSGGSDLDPGLYGQERHPETNGIVPERDSAELALLAGGARARPAGARDLPRLAGAQRRARRRPRSSTCRTTSATTATRRRPASSPTTTSRSSPARGSRACSATGRRQVASSPGPRATSARGCARPRATRTGTSRRSRSTASGSRSASCGIPRPARTPGSSRRSSTRRRRTVRTPLLAPSCRRRSGAPRSPACRRSPRSG